MEGRVKDRALEIVSARAAGTDGVNLLREYVQSRVLGSLQEAGAFVPWAFMRGTALRFLYAVPRFSEDLDFTLERPSSAVAFGATVQATVRTLEREGYVVRAKLSENTAVLKALIGFGGLEFEAGLSPHPDRVLWVKLELDTNPPAGAGLATSLIDRFGMLRLQHHDLESLFAGKIAAVLAREYAKGRDYYDLLWYLNRPGDLEPNRELLRNALLQCAPDRSEETATHWRDALRRRLADVDWADVRRDVAPFLEQPRDEQLLSAETFDALL